MSLRKLLDAIEYDYREVNKMSYGDWSKIRDGIIKAEEGGAAVDVIFVPGKSVEIKVSYGKSMNSTIASVLVNDKGSILPYTCNTYAQQVEEWAEKNSVGWEKLKSMGCKIAECEIKVLRFLP